MTHRQIAHIIRQHLDVEGLLGAYPELTRADIEAFWARNALDEQCPPAKNAAALLFQDGPPPSAQRPEKAVVARCDGASRGNPGPAAIGVVLLDADGKLLHQIGEQIENTTNNVAEYRAVVRAVEEAQRLGATRLTLLLDSELLVFQIRGVYRVKAPHLRAYHERVLGLLRTFDRWEVRHVPREQNTAADALANQALDRC